MPMIDPMFASSIERNTPSSRQRAVSTAIANSIRSCASWNETGLDETGLDDVALLCPGDPKRSTRPGHRRFPSVQSKNPPPSALPVRPCSAIVRTTATPGCSVGKGCPAACAAACSASLIFSIKVSVTSSIKVSGPAGKPDCRAARSILMAGIPLPSRVAPSSTRFRTPGW